MLGTSVRRPKLEKGSNLVFFVGTLAYRQLHDTAGELVECVWRTHAEHPIMKILEDIQRMLAEEHDQQSQFKGRFIFMSMYNDITWDQKRNEEI